LNGFPNAYNIIILKARVLLNDLSQHAGIATSK